MKALLVIKDCWDAVDGEDKEGVQGTDHPKSMKAKALMLAGVEDIHLAALEELDSARKEYLLRFEAEGEQQEHQAVVHAAAAPQPKQNKLRPQLTVGGRGRGQVSSTSKPAGQRALVPGKHGQVKNVQCHNCQRWGHYRNQCPRDSSNSSGGQGAANTLTAIA
jgi:hypothetical protein